MNNHVNQPAKDIETVLAADQSARLLAIAEIEKMLHMPLQRFSTSFMLLFYPQ